MHLADTLSQPMCPVAAALAVAPPSSKLQRIDSADIKPEARWHADARAYASRADLVLPYLLLGYDKGIEQDTARWTQSTPATITTARRTGPSVEELGQDEAGDRTSYTLCPSMRSSVWPSESRFGHQFFWENVCCAGRRWRGPLLDDATAFDQDRARDSDANFFQKCLRHRGERARMRLRHRREERYLSKKGHLRPECASEGFAFATEANAKRLKSRPCRPSTLRLEAELALKARHARDRIILAEQHLSLHIGEVMASEDAQTVLKLLGSRVENDESNVACAGASSRGEQIQLAGLEFQESGAAWTSRIPPRESHHGEEEAEARSRTPNRGVLNEGAATKVQSVFRGFHVRATLQV